MWEALYGPDGFYTKGEPPARHFRTSVHASPHYAQALLALLREVDDALGRPTRLDLVDMGAADGRLVGQVLAAAGPALAGRIAAHAVEVAPRPADADPRIRWRRRPPPHITGLVIASEWLDNVPLDVAELTPAGPRLVLVDRTTGAERLGTVPGRADLSWMDAWWPLHAAGERAEIGRPRCRAWAALTARIQRGLAVAADYGHVRASRPGRGTLTGYLDGRVVPPVPDGSRDITAHVALDACAQAGAPARAGAALLTTQRQALRALGLDGRPPPLALADSDPAGYARALCQASHMAELTDLGGLGGFGWLVQAVRMPLPASLAPLAA